MGSARAVDPARPPTTEELGSSPSITALYAKAVAGSLLPAGRPDALPERRLALREVEIDLDRLARYARVCGYGIGANLPPTYPNVFGFPLELELMTATSFPFPVIGVVHIANRIEQRRPIPVDARPDVLVWADNLRAHRRGRQFDVVTEVEVDGETVWREQSTYLRPGGGGEPASGDEPDADAGQREAAAKDDRDAAPEGEVAAVWRVPGDIGRRYGDVSGDRNPIHIHSLTAKPFGFPGAIAHGMWMMARCLAALEPRLPERFEAAVEFRRPLRIPGTAALRIAPRDPGFDFTLERPRDARPHLTGSVR